MAKLPKRRGLDKYLSPNGFWDRFLTFNIIAVLIILVQWLNLSTLMADQFYLTGLLIGLVAGQLTLCVEETLRQLNKPRKYLGLLFYSIPVGMFLLFLAVTSSSRLALGYFFGLGVSYCFGTALVALIRRLKRKA